MLSTRSLITAVKTAEDIKVLDTTDNVAARLLEGANLGLLGLDNPVSLLIIRKRSDRTCVTTYYPPFEAHCYRVNSHM